MHRLPLGGLFGLKNYRESNINYHTDIKESHMTDDNNTKRQNRERGFWDSFAKKYDNFIDKNATSSYERLLKELKADSYGANELLEIATGTGLLSIELQSLLQKITAIDISPEMIAIANQKLEDKQITNIEFKVGDSYQLEFSDSSYDLLLASNVLHLLFQPEIALKEMIRVVKPNGKIIIPTFMHGQNLKSHILSRFMGIVGFKARNRWSVDSFKVFVEKYRLQIDKAEIFEDRIPLLYLVAKKTE